MTRKALIRIAKLEIPEWTDVPPGLVIATLFVLIHRVTTGETVEETFFTPTTEPQLNYEI